MQIAQIAKISGVFDKKGMAKRFNEILRDKFKKLNKQIFRISLLYDLKLDLRILYNFYLLRKSIFNFCEKFY